MAVQILVRSTTLLVPLSEVADCHVAGHCPRCRVRLELHLAVMAAHHPKRLLGHVIGHLRCSRCGAPPQEVYLVEPGRLDAPPDPGLMHFVDHISLLLVQDGRPSQQPPAAAPVRVQCLEGTLSP